MRQSTQKKWEREIKCSCGSEENQIKIKNYGSERLSTFMLEHKFNASKETPRFYILSALFGDVSSHVYSCKKEFQECV